MINSSRITFGSQNFTSTFSILDHGHPKFTYQSNKLIIYLSYSLSLGFSIIFTAFKLVLNNWYLTSPESHQ